MIIGDARRRTANASESHSSRYWSWREVQERTLLRTRRSTLVTGTTTPAREQLLLDGQFEDDPAVFGFDLEIFVQLTTVLVWNGLLYEFSSVDRGR